MASPGARRRVLPVAVAWSVALAGCATGGAGSVPTTAPTTTTVAPTTVAPAPSTTPTTEGWGERAVRYLDGFVAAVNEFDPELVLSFFTTTARVTEFSSGQMLGGSAIEAFLESLNDVDGFAIEPGPVFLGWRSALMPARLDDAPLAGGTPVAAILSFTFIDGRIDSLEIGYPLSVVAEMGIADEGAVAAAEDLYAGYVDALATGDADRFASLYWSSAWWRDELTGGRLVGADAIAAETGGMLEETPDVTFRVRSLAPRDGEPARPELYAGATGIIYARYDLAMDACAMSVLSAWSLDERGILSDRVSYEQAGYRSCFGAFAPPEGWWRDVVIPTAGRTRTGTLEVSGTTIDLYNASATQTALVEWAVGRFAAAGLGPPALAAVTFPPTTLCRQGHTGLAISTGDRYEVALCMTDDEICRDGGCATPSLVAGRAAVHELAHVWTAGTLTEPDREAFLDIRGLDAWTGEDVPWEARGTEHASEILTWALMDPPVAVDRLPETSCDALTAAYRVLTGIDPPPGRAGC